MILGGYPDGTFAPDNDITRAEVAAIVVRALGLPEGIGTNAYVDVKSTDWFCGYIETATTYGLITGYSDGTFGPNDKITREQAMTIVARAMAEAGLDANLTDSQLSAVMAGYPDSGSVSAYARTGVAACVSTGIVTGRTDGTLSPADYITRAEVAVIISRLLQQSGLI
jgi:hypothetical protein